MSSTRYHDPIYYLNLQKHSPTSTNMSIKCMQVSVLWVSTTEKLLTFCGPRKESTKGTPWTHVSLCRLASISFGPPEEPPIHPCPSLLGRYVFIGPMEDVLLCLNCAESSLKEIGLNIAIERCELLCNGLPDHPLSR